MPLKTDLVAVWCENADPAEDLYVNDLDLTDHNTVGTASGKVGTAGDFEASSTQYLSHASTAALQFGPNDPFTVAGWFSVESDDVFMALVCKGKFDVGASDGEYLLRTTNGNRFQFIASDGTNLGIVAANFFGDIPVGTWCYVQAQYDPVGELVRIRVNDGAWDEQPYSTGIRSGTDTFAIGLNAGASFTIHYDGLANQVALWRAVKSDSDLEEIYAGGAGLPFSDWDGSSPITATPNTATVTVSGVSPSLTFSGITQTPGVGTVTVTGVSPAAGLLYTATPGTATVTVSGVSPPLSFGELAVTPGVATAAVSGVAPPVTLGTQLTPGDAAVTVTGVAPALAFGTLTLTPNVATVTVSGVSPPANRTLSVSPAVASVGVSGVQPAIATGNTLTPEAASVAVSGQAPGIDLGTLSVSPGVAEVRVTGRRAPVPGHSEGSGGGVTTKFAS